MIKTSKRILLVGNEHDSFYYVVKTTSGKFLVIEVDTQTEITDDTDMLARPVVVYSRESFNDLLNDRWIKHGLITREEADVMLNQDEQEMEVEPIVDARPYELGISSISYESNLIPDNEAPVPIESDVDVVPYSEMKEGMLVKDKDGMIGFIENCNDIHNVQIRYGSNSGAGMGLFCVDPGCEDYERLYRVVITTGTKTAISKSDSPLKLNNVRTMMADIQREVDTILRGYFRDTSVGDVSKMVVDTLKSRCPYDVEKHFQASAEKSTDSVILSPLNLITALWMKGLMVNPESVVNDSYYEDEVAIYQMDDSKGLCITPKASANLFGES